ncbi:MAG: hypothetical protein AAB414_05005 [Patescibacteria group bacterium]
MTLEELPTSSSADLVPSLGPPRLDCLVEAGLNDFTRGMVGISS